MERRNRMNKIELHPFELEVIKAIREIKYGKVRFEVSIQNGIPMKMTTNTIDNDIEKEQTVIIGNLNEKRK